MQLKIKFTERSHNTCLWTDWFGTIVQNNSLTVTKATVATIIRLEKCTDSPKNNISRRVVSLHIIGNLNLNKNGVFKASNPNLDENME